MTEPAIFDARYSKRVGSITQFETNKYVLIDRTRTPEGITTLDLNNSIDLNTAINFEQDTDNRWLGNRFNNAQKDNAALEAHYNSEIVYDYFLFNHGRRSYDDLDGPINSYVHYSNGYPGAFYIQNSDGIFVYGDGGNNGQGFKLDACVDIDIVAHEFSHAMIESENGPLYVGEQGAINESLCDIWGIVCKNYKKQVQGKPTIPIDWRVGNEIDSRPKQVSGLRTLNQQFEQSQPQPKYYGDDQLNPFTRRPGYWVDVPYPGFGPTPAPENDYLFVHNNSGVMNYWFYLLVEGGSGTNHEGYNYNVGGIGMDRAAQIVYRAMTVYIGPYTHYGTMRTACDQSAKDLFGNGSFEDVNTNEAWNAVNVATGQAGPTYASVSVTGSTGFNPGPFIVDQQLLSGPTGYICSTAYIPRMPDDIKEKYKNKSLPKEKKGSSKIRPLFMTESNKEKRLIKNVPKEINNRPVTNPIIKVRRQKKQNINQQPVVYNINHADIENKVNKAIKEGLNSIEKINLGGKSTSQGIHSISIGNSRVDRSQDSYSVCIGDCAGEQSQSHNSVAIGHEAGNYFQKNHSVAIGPVAGYNSQEEHSVAIGSEAGREQQGLFCVAIGDKAGYSLQERSIAIGMNAGFNNQQDAIAIGTNAGEQNQGSLSVAIGTYAGRENLGNHSIAIGFGANTHSATNQTITLNASGESLNPQFEKSFYVNPVRNDDTIRDRHFLQYNDISGEITYNKVAKCEIGPRGPMGHTGPRGKMGIAGPRGTMGLEGPVGPRGYTGPKGIDIKGKHDGDFMIWNESRRKWEIDSRNVKIGRNSGYLSTSTGCISIGELAGKSFQNNNSISIGNKSGENSQGECAISIGEMAGNQNQQNRSISIGYKSGYQKQGSNSVAIGNSAGMYSLGNNCIAIGSLINTTKDKRARNTIDNSICLNASKEPLKIEKPNSFYVSSISSVEDTTGLLQLFYDPKTKEIVFKE